MNLHRIFASASRQAVSNEARRITVMGKAVTVGLAGDFDHSVPAHQAIPLALKRAADVKQVEMEFEWVLRQSYQCKDC